MLRLLYVTQPTQKKNHVAIPSTPDLYIFWLLVLHPVVSEARRNTMLPSILVFLLDAAKQEGSQTPALPHGQHASFTPSFGKIFGSQIFCPCAYEMPKAFCVESPTPTPKHEKQFFWLPWRSRAESPAHPFMCTLMPILSLNCCCCPGQWELNTAKSHALSALEGRYLHQHPPPPKNGKISAPVQRRAECSWHLWGGCWRDEKNVPYNDPHWHWIVPRLSVPGPGLRPRSHWTRNTSQYAHANYGTHCGKWECSHSLQATSKGLHANFRAHLFTRSVWMGP